MRYRHTIVHITIAALLTVCSVLPPLPAAQLVPDSTAVTASDLMLRARSDEQELLEIQRAPIGEQTFQRLHNLFSRSADVPVPAENGWTGLRNSCLMWLKTASPEIQRAWSRYAGTAAASDLAAAIDSTDESLLLEICRQYPLTETELQAQTILMAIACLRGDPSSAELRRIQLTAELSGTHLEAALEKRQPALQALEKAAFERTRPVEPATATPLLQPQPEPLNQPQPWPQPQWTWRERVVDLPGLPAPDLSRMLLDAAPNPPFRMLQFHRWPVVRWHSWMLVRSPARLVALDAERGAEVWSVPALLPPHGLHSHLAALGQPESPLTREMLRPTWGKIVTNRDSCLMIDGFAPKEPNRAGNQFNVLQRASPPAQHRHGSRLICLELPAGASLPRIRWAAGTDRHEHIQITTVFPPSQSDSVQPDTDTRSPSLTEHLFVSLPEVVGNRLYVVTHSPDYIVLNCLDHRTGKVIWQQPLGHLPAEESPERYRATTECSASGRTIICTLQTGLLLCVSQLDGSILWVRQLAVDSSEISGSLLLHTRSEPAEQTAEDHTAAAETSVYRGHIVCSEPGRQSISCFDAVSGSKVWSVPHIGSGRLATAGKDLHVLLHDGDRLILSGTGHCRCLDPDTGQQRWLVTPGNLSGTGVVSGNFCLLPIRGGTTAVVDLERGCLMPGSRVTLPIRVHSFAGACSVEQDRIFSATCGSVIAWPSAERILRKHKRPVPSQGSPDNEHLTIAMAEARLSGNSALQLRSAELRAAGREGAADAVDGLHTDLLLETLVEALNGTTADPLAAADLLQQVASMKPDDRRMSRANVMAGLLGVTIPAAPESQQHMGSLDEIVPVTQTWSLCPLSLALTHHSAGTTSEGQHEISPAKIETALLDPGALPNPDQRLALLKLLQSSGMYEAADLFGCAWLTQASKNVPSEFEVAHDALFEMRNELQNAVYAFPEAARQTSPPAAAWTIVPAVLPALPGPMDNGNVEFEPVEKVPAWLRFQLQATASENSETLLLRTVNESGSAISELTTANTGQRYSVQMADNCETAAPGLIALSSRNRLTVLHAAANGQLSSLWSTPVRRSPDSDEPILTGPITPGRIFWIQGGSLHCSHALTGRELWQRSELPVSEDLPFFFSPSDRLPLFGDESAVVLYNPFSGTRTAWEAETGKFLSQGPLQISLGNRPVSCGRFLIAPNDAGRLQIIDGVSGADLLASQPEIVVPPQLIHRFCCQLPGNKLLVAAGSQELVAVDLNTGQTLFRTTDPRLDFPASDFFAFESDGQLYVLLRSGDRAPEPRGVMSCPEAGCLIRLNPADGTILWVRDDLQRCQLHRPAGRNSEVFVMLQSLNEFEKIRSAGAGSVDVTISVIRNTDGKELPGSLELPLKFPVFVRRADDAAAIEILSTGLGARLSPNFP